NEISNIIPEQQNGYTINAESTVLEKTEQAAKELFGKAAARLMDVNRWHELAGELLAHFQLTDQAGQEVGGPPSEGWFFKIDVPGPGSKAGDGFDWVRIEELETFSSPDVQRVSIRVRPASNPTKEEEETAHFYS